MKAFRIVVVCGLGAMSLLAATSAMGKGKDKKTEAAPPKDPMMEAMAKNATPGPQHKMLKAWAGTWAIAGKMWMAPGKPPMESPSTAEVKVLNDLWVTEDVKGEFMGKPFVGHGVHGYDNAKQKFVGSWVDNFGSYIMTSEGTPDASGKVINSVATELDVMTGKPSTVREVMTLDSDTKHTMTMYKTGPDGKEMKIMELVYTKK
jgi:hypothetical protein